MKANHNVQTPVLLISASCFLWFKDTKMKANHNISRKEKRKRKAVSYGLKIVKLAHIRMALGKIIQSVWNRKGYVVLYQIVNNNPRTPLYWGFKSNETRKRYKRDDNLHRQQYWNIIIPGKIFVVRKVYDMSAMKNGENYLNSFVFFHWINLLNEARSDSLWAYY